VQTGWQITVQTPSQLIGQLVVRTHTAVVDITHDTKNYTIKYRDSTNLDAAGGQIHRNYNMWVQDLDRRMRIEIASMY
jgi:hypothetical protein